MSAFADDNYTIKWHKDLKILTFKPPGKGIICFKWEFSDTFDWLNLSFQTYKIKPFRLMSSNLIITQTLIFD